MIFVITMLVILTGLSILQDWFIYKFRGRVQPDDPADENPPIITGPEDAGAQRLIELYVKKQKDKPEK
jgi:hypothetical protein